MSDLQPDVSTGKRFNVIWIVPLVALVIGIYMVIHTKMTEGPTITVSFKSAEGLEAGKTRLRYRSVDIGQVQEVSLAEGMKTVDVTIELERAAAPLLREDTRFWVVRARVGAGSISGLGTLLSGAYIHLDPGTEGREGVRHYVGLESPPLTPVEAPGLRLVLHSEDAHSISAGDAILYNGFKVGGIEKVTLDSEKKVVRYDAFIDAPYDDLVNTNTRFWNVSGISVDASAGGVRVSAGSLDTILLGGVAFDELPGQPPGEKAKSGAVYKLNASYHELQDNPYQHGIYFVTTFTQSLRGLAPGAPVEYRGIRFGQVKRILIKELVADRAAGYGQAIPVLLYLEPGRLGVADSEESNDYLRQTITEGISRGLRTTLETGNLITGSLYVSLDYYPDEKPVANEKFEDYTVIPSIPSGLGRLEHKLLALLDKIDSLPLEDTVAGANTVLAELSDTLDSLGELLDQEATQALTAELSATLAGLRETLAGLSPDSPGGQALSNSLYQLNKTLQNVEKLTRTLSEKPNSLVFPAATPADPIPEASRR